MACRINGKGEKVEIVSRDLSFKSGSSEEKEGDGT